MLHDIYNLCAIIFFLAKKVLASEVHSKLSEKCEWVFVNNVPPTVNVIWRRSHGLGVSSDRLEEPGIKLGTPVYKASGLSTTPCWLLFFHVPPILWVGRVNRMWYLLFYKFYWSIETTVKPVLSGHLEIDKTKVLMENGSSICNTFDLH